ncbi:hypothetical protein GCM10022212_00180 [Actimicrobium antarcticum]|uniref:Uncharacterized protein n=1 Tax=Actimicrobium antarcticum TaxID=1051899 RepID=A0ABP7SFU8_9BURK
MGNGMVIPTFGNAVQCNLNSISFYLPMITLGSDLCIRAKNRNTQRVRQFLGRTASL